MSSHQHAYQDSQMPPAQDQQHAGRAAEGQQGRNYSHNEMMQGLSKQMVAASGNTSLEQLPHEGCSLSTVSDTTETQMSKGGPFALATTSTHAGCVTEHCDGSLGGRLQLASEAHHPADLESIAASRTAKPGRQLLDPHTRLPRFDELDAVVEALEAPTLSNVSSAAEIETQWGGNGLSGDDRIETQGVLATFQRPRTAEGASATHAEGLLACGLGGAEDHMPRHSTPKADIQSTPHPFPSSATSLGSGHSMPAATPSASAHSQQQRNLLSQTRGSPSQPRARLLTQTKSGALLNAHPISKITASAKKPSPKKSEWGSSSDSDSGEGDSSRSDGRSSSKRTKAPELAAGVMKKRKMQSDKGDSDQENTRLSQSPSAEHGRASTAGSTTKAQPAIARSPIRNDENNMDLDNSPCTLTTRPVPTASSAAPSSFDPSSLAPGLVAGSSSHLGTQDMSVQVGTAPSHELFSNSTSTEEANVSEANVTEQAMNFGVEREPYIAAISQIPDADEVAQGQESQFDELEESGPAVVEQPKKASRKPAASRAKHTKAHSCEEEVDELESSVPAVEPQPKKATSKPTAPRAKKAKQKEQIELEGETAEVDELESEAQSPPKELKRASKKRAQPQVKHSNRADRSKQTEDHLAGPGRSSGIPFAQDPIIHEGAQEGATMSIADATAGAALDSSALVPRSTSVRVAEDYNGGTLELLDGQPASSAQFCVPAGSSNPASYPASGPVRSSSHIDNNDQAGAIGISDTTGKLEDINSLAKESELRIGSRITEGGKLDGAAVPTGMAEAAAAASSSIPSRPGNRHSRTSTSTSNRTEGEADSTSITTHGRSIESLAGRSLRRLSERCTGNERQQEQPRSSSPGYGDTQTQVVQQIPTSSPKATTTADQQDISEAKSTDPASPATSATERSTFYVPDSQHPGRILAREEDEEEDEDEGARGAGFTEEQSHNVSTQDEEGNDSTTSLLEPGTVPAHEAMITETVRMDLSPCPSSVGLGQSPPKAKPADNEQASIAQTVHSPDDSPLPDVSSVALRRSNAPRYASPSPNVNGVHDHPDARSDQDGPVQRVSVGSDTFMAATEQDISASSTARQTRQRVKFDKAADSLEAETSDVPGTTRGKRNGRTRQHETRGSADQGRQSDGRSAPAADVRAAKRSRLSLPAASEDEDEHVVPQVVARLPEPVSAPTSSRREDKGKGRAEAASSGRKASNGPTTAAATSTARRVRTSSSSSGRAGQSTSHAGANSVVSTSKTDSVSVSNIDRETRVFGLENGYYYPGTLCLTATDASQPFQLVFDDTTSVYLHMDGIDRTVRFCRLYEGDLVVSSRDLDRVRSGKVDRASLIRYKVTKINVKSAGKKQGRKKAWGEDLKATDQLRVRAVDEPGDSDLSSIVDKLDLEDAVLVRQTGLDDRRALSEADITELEGLLEADPEANQSKAAREATVSVGSSRFAPDPAPRSTSAAQRLAKPGTSKKAARSEGGLFERIGLIFTSGDAGANDDAACARKEALNNAREQSEANGATLIDGFDALIVTADDHGESQTDTRLSFNFTAYSELEAIYLIAPLAVTTPKYLLALGVGVPCISPDWVTESLKDGHLEDWRTHALGAGVSATVGRHCLGLQAAIMKYDAFDAGSIAGRQAELRLLRGKRVIFVHGKDSKSKDRARIAQRLMTVLGAIKVEVIAQAAVSKKLGAERISQFDMLVSDCGKTKMPTGLAFRSWDLIKESMIAGRLLPSS